MKRISLIAAAMLASLSIAAHAAHGGAGGGQMGGMSPQHMSGQGIANTNGPGASDRDLGLNRAQDRRNAEATSHQNADIAQGKHKHSSKHTAK